MALQTTGPISLANIGTEFEDTAPHTLSEFYGSGGAPASGPLSIGDFYGLAGVVPLHWNHATGDDSVDTNMLTGGSIVNDWQNVVYSAYDGTDMMMMSTLITSKPVWGAPSISWTSNTSKTLHRLATIADDGTVSNQTMISRVAVIPENVQYNIPAYVVYDYIGWIGQDFYHGRIFHYRNTNTNIYSTTQDIYNSIQYQCDLYSTDSKATNVGDINIYAIRSRMPKTTTAYGLEWLPSEGQVFGSFSYNDAVASYDRLVPTNGIVF